MTLDLKTYNTALTGVQFQQTILKVIEKGEGQFLLNIEGNGQFFDVELYDAKSNTLIDDSDQIPYPLDGQISGDKVLSNNVLYVLSTSENDDKWLVDLFYENENGFPEADMYEYYRARLKQTQSRKEVKNEFTSNDTNAKAIITDIYRMYLQRDPDPAGLAYWVGRYKNGMPLEEIQRAFRNSDEYKSRHQ